MRLLNKQYIPVEPDEVPRDDYSVRHWAKNKRAARLAQSKQVKVKEDFWDFDELTFDKEIRK